MVGMIHFKLSDRAALQKNARALFRPDGYFFLIRDAPLSQHHRALGFQDHHPPQHSDRRAYVLQLDQATFDLIA
jgi:hypothetical protein